MKLAGKVLLVFASILFIVDAIFFGRSLPERIVAANEAIQANWFSGSITWLTLVLACLRQITYLLGAIGGICIAFDLPLFKKSARKLLWTIIIMWIISNLSIIYYFVRGSTTYSEFLTSIVPASLANIFFVFGYIFGRGPIKKK